MLPPESIFGVTPIWPVVYSLAAIALGLSAYWFYRRVLLLLLIGRSANRVNHLWKRLIETIAVVFSQSCSLRSVSWKDRAGIGHFFIAWGFIAFFSSYLLFIFGESAYPGLSTLLLGETAVGRYAFLVNSVGLLLLGALLWAVVRRWVAKPPRLSIELTQSTDALIIVALIITIISLAFLSEGFYLASGEAETARGPVGKFLAQLFINLGLSVGTAATLHAVSWWIHFALIMGFAIYIPFSKHLHMVISPLTIFFRSLEPRGSIELVRDLETAKGYSSTSLQNFTWKELLDGYACAICGRCTNSCPAYLSGKPLSPMHLMHNMKDYLLRVGPGVIYGSTAQALIGDVITEEVIWDCTICRACQEECPVMVEHTNLIIDLRRHLVEQSRVSPNVAKALESMRLLGNPWEQPQSGRLDWAEGRRVKLIRDKEKVEVLYWVGCAGAYDPRSRDISLAMVRLLDEAGINYALLGTEERCCGDPARRMGEEGLFQMLACSNIEVLKKYSFKRILTHCPHCYNMLKNEYPQLGAQFEVVHHSQFLLELIRSGRIKPQEGPELRLTFHDPCYLGRYNGMYDLTRQVLQAIPKTTMVEMKLNRGKAMCCGAGGGQIWIQSEKGRRIEDMRFEQVQEVNVQVVATACPYCTIMLDVAAKIKEPTGRIKVMDIAELVVKALGQRV